MSTGAILTFVVAMAVIVIGVALAVRAVARGRGGGRRKLRRRFGPEYEAAVARHDGDTKAAEKDLDERLRRHKDVRVLPLPAAAREQYVAQWAGIQEQFVDAPTRAVTDAEVLLGRLAGERGFPAGERDELVDALSVHHPRTVHGLREIHNASARARADRAPTEELREALVRARGLFEELVTAHPEDHRPQRHARRGGPGQAKATRKENV
ncbi:hypothetical protein [Streptomyces sp. ISL-11]|uniref:hypothetical protein n=1 Tax=Streptomyces sp. ISL-11 TaxID=2819174 RepID=UPI001BEC8F8C|nr:hypothetical protein [Streptomyces sp. ISL-11]MBT2382965.1 hypothetical protein [Streptomyces sp. ISL-11]